SDRRRARRKWTFVPPDRRHRHHERRRRARTRVGHAARCRARARGAIRAHRRHAGGVLHRSWRTAGGALDRAIRARFRVEVQWCELSAAPDGRTRPRAVPRSDEGPTLRTDRLRNQGHRGVSTRRVRVCSAQTVGNMMETWKIGSVRVTRVIDILMIIDPKILLPDATPDNLAPMAQWLKPHFVNEDWTMPLSIHAFLVESEGAKIVVDTCIGNDKQRGVSEWSQRNGTFLKDLAGRGAQRESVDFVLCTHLHVDHVGFN